MVVICLTPIGWLEMLHADQTRRFLRSIVLPTSVPPARQLRTLYGAPLKVKGGADVLLPTHPGVYQDHLQSYGHVLEPDTRSQAWALSTVVTSAVHLRAQLHSELGDELSVAGEHGWSWRLIAPLTMLICSPSPPPNLCPAYLLAGRVDELFGRVMSLMGAYVGPAIQRNRNRTEPSVTKDRARPDFMVLMQDTLLLKGEDKPQGGRLGEAREDLMAKVKTWSASYHGKVGWCMRL